MKNRNFKVEVEGFLMAAQHQTLRTNATRAKMEKNYLELQVLAEQRKRESDDHLFSTCSISKLQREIKLWGHYASLKSVQNLSVTYTWCKEKIL